MGHLGFSKEEVFKALAERLHKNPVGAPYSETLMKILKILYTEEEAAVGSRFPGGFVTFDQLLAATGLSSEELAAHLENMASKGLVIDVLRNGETYYMLTPTVVGFFEYTFMRVDSNLPLKDLAELFEAYHHEPGVPEEFFGSPTKMFRALPYEEAISPEVKTEIVPYERAVEIVKSSGGGALTYCYCRHQQEHLGKKCKVGAPVADVCISLGSAAEWLIRRGFARKASEEELLQVLEKAKKFGLVHSVDNVQNKPAYICNCCGCCCGVIRAINEHNVPSIEPSSFILKIFPEKCSGCGNCVKKCQINALSLIETEPGNPKSKKAHVNKNRCIGCGVCVTFCKKEALTLIKRDSTPSVPLNKKEQMYCIALEKGRL
ncbi:4Fe-4S binding protein [Carboxydothermus hydrogenoformans]|uniref:Iron-sulfur cluster-binding protein n=2 Tax=Carboxydothermus hydrogenoformans TaxID=129958 RepID=Q3AFW7_CARHZ|nr:4Fe-4S binding protein [Carboxydothermus hydrogenoformans]ABB13766.1 iron-sulfur cluster-binding protein [Carboxydothermus hydrogenoformans Z-2901]